MWEAFENSLCSQPLCVFCQKIMDLQSVKSRSTCVYIYIYVTCTYILYIYTYYCARACLAPLVGLERLVFASAHINCYWHLNVPGGLIGDRVPEVKVVLRAEACRARASCHANQFLALRQVLVGHAHLGLVTHAATHAILVQNVTSLEERTCCKQTGGKRQNGKKPHLAESA